MEKVRVLIPLLMAVFSALQIIVNLFMRNLFSDLLIYSDVLLNLFLT